MIWQAIGTHENAHLDEYLAILLLRSFGEEMFPGIKEAKVVYIDHDRKASELEGEGILPIGIGGGELDEHPTAASERKEGECSATLVAKKLGISDDPALEQILKYALESDLKGSEHPFGIAGLVKILHQQCPNDPEKVMKWAMMGLDAKLQEQLSFWGPTKEEFERIAEVEEILGPKGKTLKMTTCVSDNEQMSKFARSVCGGRAAIIIQQGTKGNTQIFTNKRFGLTLYDIVQMVRIKEQQAKVRARKLNRLLTFNWQELSLEGTVKGAEEWFFHKEGQMLLNGSLTAPEVPPTLLSLEQIKEIVRIGINPNAFEPNRATSCKQGVCVSSPSGLCPWHAWGLHRCRQIRFKMRKE